MLYCLLSPAKRQDFASEVMAVEGTQPLFKTEIADLMGSLRQLSPEQLQDLMHLSQQLTALNHQRFIDFDVDNFSIENARPALQAFQGDAFRSLAVEDFSTEDWTFAQQHLGIISGLYGLLRPQDLMQAYRLEMKTPLANSVGNNLYDFWQSKIAHAVNQQLAEAPKNTLVVNLASNEYNKAVDHTALNFPVVDIMFKEFKNNQYRVVAVVAKRARGLMTRYIIKNRLSDCEQLQNFTESGYAFNTEQSTDSAFVFTRNTD